MAEFISMTLLSAEPVAAAKPQAMQSNDGSTEPDQSFAATLAAEVNGKHPEKSAKALAKTRQNNASDSTDNKDGAVGQGASSSDVKNDKPKSVSSEEAEAADEDDLLSAGADTVLVQNDKDETEQSHWLNLLEKAKSLQQRLSKTDADSKDAAKEAASVSDAVVAQEAVVTTERNDKTKALTTLDTQSKTDADSKDAAKEAASVSDAVVAQEAVVTTEHNDKTKALTTLDTQSITSAKVKTGEQNDGSIVLDEKLLTEQSADSRLTAEELKAIKLLAQTDNTVAGKTQAADTALKQTATAESELVASEAKEKTTATDKLLSGVQKDTGPDQSKTMAHIEKQLKAMEQTAQTAQSAETEKQPGIEAQVLVGTTTVSKTPLQSEQASTLQKTATAVTADSPTEADAETLTTQQIATEAKVSVQAQSAAALIAAPAAQQAKAPATEAKATTEEVLKQIQTAALTAQGEQGASSSSGEPSQQGPAEAILTVIEQQKGSHTVATETNSFSSQLKSSLEKTSQAILVAGREQVSESTQKQVDQLGQKLNLIQPEASNQLKEKMLMMVKDKVHTAEIRLDPSELGSMQIKISLQQDQMSVQFMVQQGNAKELMEQQMPKLKELLQQQGIELSQGSVQQQNQSSAGQEGGRRTAGGSSIGTALNASDETVDPALLPTKNSDRVVDYYA
jgi:flagellar hook-length control protein FliK